MQTNDSTFNTSQLDSSVFVQSQTELFSIQYDQNVYLDPSTNETEAVAYIDRDEAWAVYGPRLQTKAAPFMAAWNAAENSGDAIRTYYGLLAAAKLVPDDLESALDFGQLLNPQKAADFDAVRKAIGSISQETTDAKGKIALFVQINDDSQNQLTNAIGKAFSDQGFKLVGDESLSSNWVEAKVEPNREDLQAGTFYTPSIELTVYGGGGALFTWNAAVPDRRGARNPDIAKRRAYGELAGIITAQLWKQFEREIRK